MKPKRCKHKVPKDVCVACYGDNRKSRKPKRTTSDKEAQRIANVYLKDKEFKDPFALALKISERVEYYSDRWSNDGVRFQVIRIMLDECERRWLDDCKRREK